MSDTLDDLGDLAEDFGLEDVKPAPVSVAPFQGIGDNLPDEPREMCLAALAALAELTAERDRLAKEAEAGYVRELEELWRRVKAGGKRGKKAFNRYAAEKELGTTATDLAEKYLAAHRRSTVVAFEVKRAELEQLAISSARDTTIRTDGESHWYLGDVYADAFSTQTSPVHYAEARAKILADDVRAAGVRAEVRQHEASTKLPFFAVYVWCLEADLPILRKKPGLPFAEQVRLAWKYGANPRVFWPSLPHGFEEQHGIDFFGNDKVPVQTTMKAQSSESPGAPEEPEPI